jgi:transcriptional regulator with XRE-family HTH domain
MSERSGWLDLPGALRALRRRADASQRELAASSGVPPATIGRIESGSSPDPRLRTVERLVRAAGARLAIVDLDGTEPVALRTDEWRDRADRRFPPHLDPMPRNRWRRGVTEDVICFRRSRWARDELRRAKAGEGRQHLFTVARRLGPADAGLLARLWADAAEFSFAGEAAPASEPLTGPAALRYLRDPSVRHWVAEDPTQVVGQLVAHLHLRHASAPVMVVSDFGIRPEHRGGLVEVMLVAAMADEAAECGVDEIVALAADPAQAGYLCRLGFTGRLERPHLLRLPG